LSLLVCLASSGLSIAAEPVPAGATGVRPVAPAPIVAVEKREIRAQLLPRRYTTLATEIGAKIQHISVVEGSRFRAGDVLVRFDCSLQQAQLNKGKAALSGADQTWRANQRLNELNAVGKVELGLSEAEVEKAKAEVASNETMLGKCVVHAPFGGRVAEQKVREQQYVQPGQTLLEIIDDSVLELEFIVPSRWMAWIKPGYAFKVKIDETGKSYPARIQRIGARVDPVSQSIKLSAAIDGKFNDLIAGMSGQVNLTPP
jgi:membrane fusion protein, multidrug efflux system